MEGEETLRGVPPLPAPTRGWFIARYSKKVRKEGGDDVTFLSAVWDVGRRCYFLVNSDEKVTKGKRGGYVTFLPTAAGK